MGISRDSVHKRRLTGGKKKSWRKKRKHEIGRQPSNTKIGPKQIALVRVRGGNIKKRALKLDFGNFSMISKGVTRKARIVSVVYNSTNNELVRTNTLVKGNIVYVDASPFKNWFQEEKNFSLKKKFLKTDNSGSKDEIQKKKEGLSNKEKSIIQQQMDSGKLLARICSRPGQTGRADGYILEKSELEFYSKKIQKKKGARS